MDGTTSDSSAPSTTGPTRRFADFLAAISIESVDPFARRAATRHLIDSIARCSPNIETLANLEPLFDSLRPV